MERTVTIDRVGRLVIPKDLRARHNLSGGTRLRIGEDRGRIVLEPMAEEARLVERGGLLLVDAQLVGPEVDHRQVREERLAMLAEGCE